MIRRHLSLWLLALAASPLAVAAQTMVQAIPGTTTADRLAAQMRLLAVNPNDLSALLAAGELSVKLDDLGAAAAFFARADKVDPRNGRAKAGEGAILVHAERPGEALRYFAQAESYGLAPAAFAADRGLAYDLIGEQERAQRDYRLALRTSAGGGPDEETQRRYALSLAIAGKRELADQELQPLLRKSDRGAWRVHAFVLAMAGNVAEASRIATTMMPPGTAAGLQPFLEKLPTLTPVDRAFAVHFGEVRSTPQRVADARMVPPLPVLGADPYAPRVAVAAAMATPQTSKGKRRNDDKRRGGVQVAQAVPPPEPLPLTPSYRGAAGGSQTVVTRGAPPAWPVSSAITPSVRPSPSPAAVTLAASSAAPPPPRSIAPASIPATPPLTTRIVSTPLRVQATTAAVPPPPAETNVVVATRESPSTVTLPALPPAASVAAAMPSLPSGATDTPPATVFRAPNPSSVATPSAAATAPVASAGDEGAVRRRSDEAAVARIVAALPIPAAELNVAGPARPLPATPVASPDAAVDQAAAEKAARATAAKALADKRAADRKAAADKKALAEKKAAAEKKAEEAREAAAEKKLERANPERIWVQVSGGAYVADLPKAWAAAKTKGGDAFAGHATGWTTPLRATNRVLAGPFKTSAEARAFTNKLRASGIEAFPFTSDAGQIVTRLSAK